MGAYADPHGSAPAHAAQALVFASTGGVEASPTYLWLDPLLPFPFALTAVIMVAVVVVLVLRPPRVGAHAVA